MTKTGIISFRYRNDEFTIELVKSNGLDYFVINNSNGHMIHNEMFDRMPTNLEVRNTLDFYFSDEEKKDKVLNAHL